SLCSHRSLAGAFNASSEGMVSVINIEDFNEKDWSFLDSEELNSEQAKRNIDRITSVGEISESSKVLVSVGSSLVTPIQHQTREKAEGNQAVYKQNHISKCGQERP
ncbi:hypothetical protein J1N35_007264, partial [Gossypium stocksii]